MTLLLTLVICTLVVVIAALVAWEIVQRRSPMVRVWNPSSFPGRVAGGLGLLEGGQVSDRLGDDDAEVVVLLHGLGATADYFGDVYEGLANRRRLVMPDLLGFGRSLDETRHEFDLDAHVSALETALQSLGLGRARTFVAAHSMGAAVALEWAARHADRATGVALWGPPVYADGQRGDPGTDRPDVRERLAASAGGMTRLLLADNEIAERLCRLSCSHRRLSGWVMASAAPRWPIDVSRRAALHTWEAFEGSLGSLVLDADWDSLFDLDVPVTVFRGTDDVIGDRSAIVAAARRAVIVDVEGADHHVALSHPHLLFDLLGA